MLCIQSALEYFIPRHETLPPFGTSAPEKKPIVRITPPSGANTEYKTFLCIIFESTAAPTNTATAAASDDANNTCESTPYTKSVNANVYDQIGGLRAGEIVEDGFYRIVKNSKYKMLIVSGTENVTAVWARDRHTLWNAIKRLIVPIATSNQRQAIGIAVAVAFLMMIPFVLVPYAFTLLVYGVDSQVLFASSLAAAVAVFVGAAVDSKIIQRNVLYSVFAPLGGVILTMGFFSGALVPNGGSVSWRGIKYSNADCMQSTPNV